MLHIGNYKHKKFIKNTTHLSKVGNLFSILKELLTTMAKINNGVKYSVVLNTEKTALLKQESSTEGKRGFNNKVQNGLTRHETPREGP